MQIKFLFVLWLSPLSSLAGGVGIKPIECGIIRLINAFKPSGDLMYDKLTVLFQRYVIDQGLRTLLFFILLRLSIIKF